MDGCFCSQPGQQVLWLTARTISIVQSGCPTIRGTRPGSGVLMLVSQQSRTLHRRRLTKPAAPSSAALPFANDVLSKFRVASAAAAVDSVADFSYFEGILGAPLHAINKHPLAVVSATARLKVKQPSLNCCHDKCCVSN